MRKRLLSILAMAPCVLALAQCSTSQAPAGVELPEVAIVQTLSQLDMFNVSGRVSVPYVIEITNPNDFPIELDRVQLRTIGAGAYEMADSVEVGALAVPAKDTVNFQFSLPAIATGGPNNTNLPTTIRLTAYFESSHGAFRRIITETVGGYAGSVN